MLVLTYLCSPRWSRRERGKGRGGEKNLLGKKGEGTVTPHPRKTNTVKRKGRKGGGHEGGIRAM